MNSVASLTGLDRVHCSVLLSLVRLLPKSHQLELVFLVQKVKEIRALIVFAATSGEGEFLLSPVLVCHILPASSVGTV